MPSMPGSGTAVPPVEDDVVPPEVEEVVAPPEVEEVVVPPDVLEVVPPEVEEVVVPPDVLEVVEDVVELDDDELDPCLPPGLHHEKPRAKAGLATATVASMAAMVTMRFIGIPLWLWPWSGRNIDLVNHRH